MRLRTLVASLVSLALLGGAAQAAPLLTVSGFLNDAGNANLVGSGPAPDPPLFGNDFDIANNVAVYALAVAAPATVTFDSNGFAAGGVDPYFTLFQGSLPATATFLASNFVQAFSTGGDFLISLALAGGDYFVAIGAFANESFAENSGGGTLSDGFIGLGQPGLLGTYFYALEVTSDAVPPPPPLPEPSSLLLLVLGLAAVARARRLRDVVRKDSRP